jgi:hypothetical protein
MEQNGYDLSQENAGPFSHWFTQKDVKGEAGYAIEQG